MVVARNSQGYGSNARFRDTCAGLVSVSVPMFIVLGFILKRKTWKGPIGDIPIDL